MNTTVEPNSWVNASGENRSGSATSQDNNTSNGSSNLAPPSLPTRPTSLNSAAPSASYGGYSTGNSGVYGGNFGGYGGYGNYGAGGYGAYGSYSSPYSRYGGGYGASNLGGPYGGAVGYGGYTGANGTMVDPNNMRIGLEQSTAATFQLIESLVGAVGGFAQMLESTYMATHSSFFAMVAVAEQFGHLKNSLGSVLGVFAIIRWAKALIAKITGRSPPNELTAANFAKMTRAKDDRRLKTSLKPLIILLATVFGFPWLLGKLIRALAAQQDLRGTARNNNTGDILFPGSRTTGNEVLDPSKLDFCRAKYDFVPENPQIELELHKGDLVAILSRTDPLGNPSMWWRARSRDGKTGYIPSTYVEVIPRKSPSPHPENKPSLALNEQGSSSNGITVDEFKKSSSN